MDAATKNRIARNLRLTLARVEEGALSGRRRAYGESITLLRENAAQYERRSSYALELVHARANLMRVLRTATASAGHNRAYVLRAMQEDVLHSYSTMRLALQTLEADGAITRVRQRYFLTEG